MKNIAKIRNFILLILAFLFFSTPESFSQDILVEPSLALDKAIEITLKNNKDIQAEEQNVDYARAKIVEARSQFLPELNLNASYTRNAAVAPTLAQGKKDPGVFVGYKNDNQVGLSLGQTIYNGGANLANYKQSQLGFWVSKETLRAKKLDIEFEIKRLYFGLLLAFETQRIAQDLVDQANAHYQDVQNKFSQGTSSRFDLLQSKVQVSKLMPQLVKANNSIDLITIELKKAMGIKLDDNFVVKEKLGYSLVDIEEGEFLKKAYLNQPQMILKSLDIDINKWAIDMAKAGYRPTLSASAGYNYRSSNLSNMINKKHNTWDAGVSISVPIFDGFSSKAKVDEAKAKYEQSRIQKDNLTDQIAVDVRSACLDLKEAKAIIDSQEDNVGEAQEALRISIVSYDNGVGTNLDVLDSQTSLAQVEQNLAEGIYDYLMAKADLDKTMGQEYLSMAANNQKPAVKDDSKQGIEVPKEARNENKN